LYTLKTKRALSTLAYTRSGFGYRVVDAEFRVNYRVCLSRTPIKLLHKDDNLFTTKCKLSLFDFI